MSIPANISAATLSKSSQNKKLFKTQPGKKVSIGPGDVWERIRAGMRIPHPVATPNLLSANKTPESKLPSVAADGSATPVVVMESEAAPESLASEADSNLKIKPNKAMPPVNKYTELGARLLAGAKSPKAKIIDCTPVKNNRLPLGRTGRDTAEIARINERIKASMESHAQERRHTVIMVAGSKNNTALQNDPDTTAPEPVQAVETAKPVRISNPCAARPDTTPTTVIAADNLLKPAVQTQLINAKQLTINERINKHVLGYSQNPGFLRNVAERAQPYLYHIVDSLSKRGMPLELALLPIVESAYQPTAQSPKSAAGLWQFIPMTGKDFDLKQTSEYDERLDIPESTQAAIRFLSGLKDHFKGDWLLALAAYNAGQGTVDNAISQNQADGLPTDFWSLRLPEETQNYVPRLLALSKIFASPGVYGIKLPPVRNEPYFVDVRLGREFDVNYLAEKDIDTVAELASLTPAQFASLNPGYLNDSLPKNDSFKFLLPERNSKLLKDRLMSIEKFVSIAPVNNETVKSLVMKEESEQILDFPGSTLSLLSDLVAKKTPESLQIQMPLLSISVQEVKS